MAVLISQINFRKVVAFGSMAATILWVAIGWAQKVTFTPTSDLRELDQKVESRSKPPTVTTEEESALTSKGYVKLASFTSTSTGTGAGIAKELDDSILSRAAAVGGDVVRFDKRGVPTQVTETIGPVEKTKTRCANWVTQTTYTSERTPETCYTDAHYIRHCTGGDLRQVPYTTRTCTEWEKSVSEVGRETTLTTSVLNSEGTVWRYDPDLLAAIALQQRNDANAPKPPDSKVDDLFFALHFERKDPERIRSTRIAMLEALLKDFPTLANTKARQDTPLGFAAGMGNKELVEILLAHGAHINGRDRDGQTALFHAYTAEVAEFLISKGADVNAEDNDGYTPLRHFVYPVRYNKPVAGVLRKHGGHQ